MALSKKVTYDYDVRGEFKTISVREKTAIMEDGVELSASYHRKTIQCKDDLSAESDEIKALANTVFTDAVKKAWDDKLKADIKE